MIKFSRYKHFDKIVLDTLERLPAAMQLYPKLGFSVIEPYYIHGLSDAVFLGLDL